MLVLPRAFDDELGEQTGPDHGLVDDSALGDRHDLFRHRHKVSFGEQRPDVRVEKGL